MSTFDPVRVAAAYRALADALEGSPAEATGQPVAAVAPVAPVRRGRGRPVVGEAVPGAVVPAAATAPVATSPVTPDDPFSTAIPAAREATIELVRLALTELKSATTQDNAVAVLKKAGGADNLASLKPEHYGAVVAAAKAAMPDAAAPAPVAEVDPFATPEAALAEKQITKEELRAICVETGKRTSQDSVLKVIFEHGGKGPAPGGSGTVANFHALSADQYGAVAAALKALPTTK